MSHYLTFVAAEHNLNPEAMAATGFTIDETATQKASRHKIDSPLSIEEMIEMREKLAAHKIDIFCTPIGFHPKLFLADMDSTIVTSETLDELAAEAGIKDKVSEITERAMRGELDFHAALKERVALIKNLPIEALKRTLDNTEISKGAHELLKALWSNNVTCVLVSGGFTYFTAAIAEQLGFDHHHGNELDHDNEKLFGTVSEPILDKDSKLSFLHQYVQQLNIDISDSVAIGDGANDLPMLENAGLGIGYKPKPLVAKKILNCIIHTDLSSVLHMIDNSAI
ncbi:MAG: phosphoserine phosphatase SerB [Pseudomonadota bacterium]